MNLGIREKLVLRQCLFAEELVLSTLFLDPSDSESDSDDEFGGPRRTIPKTQDFAEVTVSQYDTKTFREHFRLSRSVFEKVVTYLGASLLPEGYDPTSRGRPAITADKTLMITLWILANKECYR